MAVVVDLLAAVATSVGAVSTEEVSVVVFAAVALVLVVFVAASLAVQPVGGGAVSRGGGVGFGSPRSGGVRSAPYRYGGTHFAGRSLGGPTGAFRYYNGGSRTSAARTYQFSGRGNQSMRSNAGRNTTVARQQNRSGITSKAKHEDLECAVVGGSPEGDGQSPGVCAP